MEALIPELSRLLNETLSPDQTLVSAAADGLDRLSHLPQFPFSLLAVATGGDNQGLRVAAAAYLKNFTRRHLESNKSSPELHVEFRNQLTQALLQAEPAVLKVLIEAFRMIILNYFVKENSWPDLVPQLKSVIQSSNLIVHGGNPEWSTINVLTLLQAILKPFQYFLNPKVSKEPVPFQLEKIANDILVPLQASFHHFVDQALSYPGGLHIEIEEAILLTCKCMYFTVRSYMPSALCPLLPAFCGDLFRIVDSLSLMGTSSESGCLLRLKTGKRSLVIFRSLITRHRKHSDKLMPSIIKSAIRIAKMSIDINMLGSLSERIVSLAFDVISHVLETGPGWRLVSPHFSSLLDSAIFPALALNQKDISEWEEDTEEFIRKNLPSELDEISGWADDLFTARKSAINLLGVIAMSKGPPTVSAASKRKKGDKSKIKERQSSVGDLLVIPFLSKFPLPSDTNVVPFKTLQDYYGVLMAYGGLQDFLSEKNPDYISVLVRNRVLPLYSLCQCSPYLVATANWVLGMLASCLPQAVSADIYSSLMKTLITPDVGDVSCYPVRASAAGAITELLENDYVPPDCLSLLQVIVNRIENADENESSLLFQLLSTVVESGQEKIAMHIPLIVSSVAGVISKNITSIPEPWTQVVERGFAALVAIVQVWEDNMGDDTQLQKNTDYNYSCASIARVLSSLLQQAWLTPIEPMDTTISSTLPSPSCLDDASCLLGFVMRSVKTMDEVIELNLRELLVVWANMIADWHAWEEMEDLSVFNSIQEALNLHKKCGYASFLMERVSHNSSNGSRLSIIEGISAFVSAAITAYPSALRRACSCVHALLHVPRFSVETQTIRQSIAVAFALAAFSRFSDIQQEPDSPDGLWKPLVLAISSCYVSYPENIEQVLRKDENNGFMIWVSDLAEVSTTSSPGLSSESEIKLAVITLAKVVERLLWSVSERGNEALHKCVVALIEASIHLKEVQEDDTNGNSDEENNDEEEDDDDEDDSDYDEDSEDDELEETEEEFLDRYAKAAAELDDGMVEEGDLEDEEHQLDLGAFEEVDIQSTLLALFSSHHQLLGVQALPQNLIAGFVDNFPQCSSFFQPS